MNLIQREYKVFIMVLVNRPYTCVLPCTASGFQLLPVPVYKSVLKGAEIEALADSPVGLRGDSQ